jgi:hypothetical protein
VRRLALLPIALVACIAQHAPGTPLGTFAVDGALKTQTCGAQMQSQVVDPWSFDVRLSRSGSTVFWLQDAAPPLSGLIDPSGNVTMKATQTYDLRGGDAGPYCGIVRSDTFTAALGTAPSPTSFTGQIAYHYDLADGSDCGGLLDAQFGAIPCDVSYDLTAKRTK